LTAEEVDVYRRFDFEGDIHATLSCVPLVVRRKLDLAGLKISLAGWQALSRAERLALCHMPADTNDDVAVYTEALRGFAERAGVPLSPLPGAPARSAWDAPAVLDRLRARLGPGGVDEAAIGRLTEEERFALHKLAEPARGVEKLMLLVRELGLTPPREEGAP
jgi:hypothetical protein